ncbi:hypothetical protein F5Y06DRAFT_269776 [Hypoxylon sp. FL0890]|nr:hypothetical protein F5Y06DRAFT_269776 [Hypoxylon sp. FL0890]
MGTCLLSLTISLKGRWLAPIYGCAFMLRGRGYPTPLDVLYQRTRTLPSAISFRLHYSRDTDLPIRPPSPERNLITQLNQEYFRK